MLRWLIGGAVPVICILFLCYRLWSGRHQHFWTEWGSVQQATYRGKETLVQIRKCTERRCGKSQVRPL